MAIYDEDILILCKTYPSPSGKYTETTCVAGINSSGALVRLFPVPFRLASATQQFKKWQWIKAKVEKARKDHRPESLNVKIDTISLGQEVPPARDWAARRRILKPVEIFSNFDDIESARKEHRISLALLRPYRIVDLEITPVSHPEWTDQELEKLVQHQNQGGLFDADDKPAIKTLKKLPYDFHYRYECLGEEGNCLFKHKLVDWEVGALYWKCLENYGNDWEAQFRAKLQIEIPSRDLIFLMGNQHRFQDKWLIISLIYPPMEKQLELL